jgi:hypothetical protein
MAGVCAARGFDLGIRGLGAAVAGGAGESTTEATLVGRRWVSTRRLFFTEVAATLWATAAADEATGVFGAAPAPMPQRRVRPAGGRTGPFR